MPAPHRFPDVTPIKMTSVNNSSEFDIRFSLQTDEDAQGELATYNTPGDTGTRELITEEEIRDTYLSARFDTVQYGTYRSQPACLVVMTFNFHASNPRSRRFRSAKITLKLTSVNPSPQSKTKNQHIRILSFAPHTSFGTLSTAKVTSTHDLSASLTFGSSPSPLASASVTPSISRSSESTKGYRVMIQGTERGNPPSRVVWSIIENPDHPDGLYGIPSKVRTATIIGIGTATSKFSAIFDVRASVGWSVDPRRWPLKMSAKDDPVLFDSTKPLHRDYEVLGPVFDSLNLDTLTEFIVPDKN